MMQSLHLHLRNRRESATRYSLQQNSHCYQLVHWWNRAHWWDRVHWWDRAHWWNRAHWWDGAHWWDRERNQLTYRTCSSHTGKEQNRRFVGNRWLSNQWGQATCTDCSQSFYRMPTAYLFRVFPTHTDQLHFTTECLQCLHKWPTDTREAEGPHAERWGNHGAWKKEGEGRRKGVILSCTVVLELAFRAPLLPNFDFCFCLLCLQCKASRFWVLSVWMIIMCARVHTWHTQAKI